MTDDAHHMSLLTLLIQGVAHRLAVDGQTLISRAIDFVPALQGLVQMRGGDADQHIAQDVLAGHDITTLFATAAKALSRFLPQALRPIRDGLVTAHPAQHGPRGDRKSAKKTRGANASARPSVSWLCLLVDRVERESRRTGFGKHRAAAVGETPSWEFAA